MPAALLLSLCISCNSRSHEAQKEYFSRQYKTPDQTTDKGAANSISSSSADSAAAGTTTLIGQPQADNERDQPQTGAGGNPAKHTGKTPSGGTPGANPDWDKKIVKTADLKLEIKNFRSYNDRLRQLVRQSGGYIAQEQQNQSVYNIENTVTIKVPVDRFDAVMTEIASDSDKLVEKKVGSEDVTMQIVDTKSRLEAKKEVRERYLELLKQAKNMKDILAVQSEINDIQEQMEEASGRISFLGHSAAFSTISLDFYQVLIASTPEDATPSFFHKIKEAFRGGWDWCSSLLLGLISLWPLWIGVGLGVIGIRKWRAGSGAKSAVPRA
jgi:hypothetical protein